MARIRTIKPDFWRSETLSEVSSESLLLAIGLLNFSDDEGYFRANPALLKTDIFPLRETSMTIHGMLTELSSVGYITLFLGSDGKQYGCVVKFKEHQNINRPTPSKIATLEVFTDNSLSAHEPLTIGKERKGKEGNIYIPPNVINNISPPSGDCAEIATPLEYGFEEFWDSYPRKVGKEPAAKAYTNQLKKGTTHESIIHGLQNHAEAWHAAGTELQFIPHAATWLNQCRFLEQPEANKRKGSRADSLQQAHANFLRTIENEG